MEDKAVIKALTTSDYKGVIYQMGKEYTVPLPVAIALGPSVHMKEIIRAVVPTAQEVKVNLKKKTKAFRPVKNAAILNDDKSVENK